MGYESTSGSYWNQLSEPTQILGSTVYIAQTIVGDGVAVCFPSFLPEVILTGFANSCTGVISSGAGASYT